MTNDEWQMTTAHEATSAQERRSRQHTLARLPHSEFIRHSAFVSRHFPPLPSGAGGGRIVRGQFSAR